MSDYWHGPEPRHYTRDGGAMNLEICFSDINILFYHLSYLLPWWSFLYFIFTSEEDTHCFVLAYSNKSLETAWGISSTYSKNKRGPNIDP